MKRTLIILAMSLMLVSLNYGQYVKIGKTGTNAKLDVFGQLKITDGTVVANSVLASDANGLASWTNLSTLGALSSSCTTANYVPKFDATDMTCSQIYDDETNIGIGTTTPHEKLEVYGTETSVYGMFGNASGNTKIGYNSAHAIIETSNDLLINYYGGKNVVIGNEGLNHDVNGNLTIMDKVGIGTAPADDDIALKLHIKNWTQTYYPGTDPTSAKLRIEDETWGYTSRDAWWDFTASAGNHKFYITSNYGDGNNKINVITFTETGNVLIGKTIQSNPDYILDVNGIIRADKVIVNTTGADFVFEKDYSLMSLAELEKSINENKHLPGMPSAAEMQTNGMSLGETNTLLLQKIEELSLYVIELQKQNNKLNERISNLENK